MWYINIKKIDIQYTSDSHNINKFHLSCLNFFNGLIRMVQM